MQPILVISAGVPGLVYVNGHLVGDAGETPVVLPVAPRGAVTLEFKPMARRTLPLAGRMTLSGGRVLPDSVTQGIWALSWPSGAVEVELTPESLDPPGERGGVDDPAATRLADGTVRLVEPLGDTVGHARLRGWVCSGGAYTEIQPEMIWEEGAPRWPQTPEDTALALAEAILLGLNDEARGYLTPAAQGRDFLPLFSGCDGCVPMKYPLPDGRPAVGLIRLEGPSSARVTPLYYRASAQAGTQGSWRIEDLLVDS